MNVFIAGGTGRVASEVIKELRKQGHQVYAGSRHPEKIEKKEGVNPVYFDLHEGTDEMVMQLSGMDAVYFLAGSRGKDLLQTDAFGAVKLMKACEKAGIHRYIQLSSIFALKPEKWKEEPSLASITDYNIAKFFADEWLIHNTSLDYTIIAPAVLEEKEGTGKIEINPEHSGTNPIPDVASVLVNVLEMKNTFGKVIELHGGETPITDALHSI